jgi:hypothetical protein
MAVGLSDPNGNGAPAITPNNIKEETMLNLFDDRSFVSVIILAIREEKLSRSWFVQRKRPQFIASKNREIICAVYLGIEVDDALAIAEQVDV